MREVKQLISTEMVATARTPKRQRYERQCIFVGTVGVSNVSLSALRDLSSLYWGESWSGTVRLLLAAGPPAWTGLVR